MNWLDLTDSVLKHSTETFGEAVTYWPKESPSFETTGVFDQAHIEVDPSSGMRIQSTTPRLGVRLSQLTAEPGEGDRVQIRGQVYEVVESQPDGQGGAVLILHRCSHV